MAKANNLISAVLYLTGALISTAAIASSNSTSTRRMSSLESELHDEAQRLESEARHIRRLERVEREYGCEVSELHRMRAQREEAEKLRKEREEAEAERVRREHEELLQLRKEVAHLRSKSNKNRSRSIPTPPLPEAPALARFPEDK